MAYLQFLEASAIFETALALRDYRAWQEAREAVRKVSRRKRNPKTIKPVLRIAVTLVEQVARGEGINLPEEAIGKLVSTAGYRITPIAVRRLVEWFRQWQEERDKSAGTGRKPSEGPIDSYTLFLAVEKERRSDQHYEDLRRLTTELLLHLPIGETRHLSFLDISKGCVANPFGSLPSIQWGLGNDGHCLRK